VGIKREAKQNLVGDVR